MVVHLQGGDAIHVGDVHLHIDLVTFRLAVFHGEADNVAACLGEVGCPLEVTCLRVQHRARRQARDGGERQGIAVEVAGGQRECQRRTLPPCLGRLRYQDRRLVPIVHPHRDLFGARRRSIAGRQHDPRIDPGVEQRRGPGQQPGARVQHRARRQILSRKRDRVAVQIDRLQ